METSEKYGVWITEPTTPADIVEIRERVKKATPGPWRACHDGKCDCGQIWSHSEDVPVVEVVRGEWGDPGFPYGKIPIGRSVANANFVSHARTDIPKLLDYIEKLEAKIASLSGNSTEETKGIFHTDDQRASL